MRGTLMLAIFTLCVGSECAQVSDRQQEADQVKAAIQNIAGYKKAKVEVHTRGLVKLTGYVDAVEQQNFRIRIKTRSQDKPLIRIGWKQPRRYATIRYSEVLQLRAKDVALSFIPHPEQTPYGDWDQLSTVDVGEILQVHLKDGGRRHGVFMRHSNDQIALMRGNTEFNLQREDITRVYRVTGDVDDVHSRIIKGAEKGAKVTDDIFPLNDIHLPADPTLIAIGAGVGMLVRLLPRRGATRVLAYAK